jgi:hypothetical protein
MAQFRTATENVTRGETSTALFNCRLFSLDPRALPLDYNDSFSQWVVLISFLP